jgi:hypothetical protein
MTNFKRSTLSISALVSFVGLAAIATGCSAPSDETVKPRLAVLDRSKSALSHGDITSITGTYGAACGGRSSEGTDAWTLSVGTAAENELVVQKNDADCVLTVTNVVTAAASWSGAPAIALATSYGAASTFTADGQRSFFANAKISATDMAADFTISVIVSDTASTDEGEKDLSSFATQSGTLSAGTVAAPNYTIGFGSFTISKDSQNEVLTTGGFAQLTAGSATGQNWAIYDGALSSSSSFEAVESAWSGATAGGLVSALTSLRIPSSAFNLDPTNLGDSPQRTVIIRNTVDGVSSYQLILVTFVD